MVQIEDPDELQREIERTSRLAFIVGDQTTYQRLFLRGGNITPARISGPCHST